MPTSIENNKPQVDPNIMFSPPFNLKYVSHYLGFIFVFVMPIYYMDL